MFGMMKKEKIDYKEEVKGLSAIFKTTLGEFEIELFHKDAPETVWNFVNLAEGRQESVKEGPYYNGLIFHRVIRGFKIGRAHV
jgi:cyclophilin family peptidyl-prolyl cis-trans isomerase